MKKNILFLSNIPTPYQLDFNRVAQNYFNFCSVFLWPAKNDTFKWPKVKQKSELKILNFKNKFKDYLYFYKVFTELSPDFLIIGGYKLPLTFFALLLAKLKKCQVVFWLERPFFASGAKRFFKELYIRFVFFFAEMVLAIGKEATTYYKAFKKKTYNFPYSMSLEKYFDIKRKSSGKKIKFLYSGQLIERKNIKAMLDAFCSVQKSNIELNIVGDGPLQELVKQYQQKDKRINFYGFIQPDYLALTYAQNDVFLFPSRHDGWALVINEAMAAAMPVIGTKSVGAVNDYIIKFKNGYLCGLAANSIKKGIIYYLQNKNKILEHGLLNRAIIKSSNGNVVNSVAYLDQLFSEMKKNEK